MMLTKRNITGLILAGGAGRRVGYKDKGLIHFEGKSLIQRQIEWMKPQVSSIIISANRNIEVYKEFGYPVLSDSSVDVGNGGESNNNNNNQQVMGDEFNGPLCGLYKGLVHCETSHLYVQPVDLPYLPKNTIGKLLDYVNQMSFPSLSDGLPASSFYLKTELRDHYLSLLIEQKHALRLKHNLDNNHFRVRDFLRTSKVEGIDLKISETNFANFNYSKDFQQK